MYPLGMARQTLTLELVVTLVVLALSACGEGGRAHQQAKVRPLPEYPKELHQGEYYTEEFKPSLSFSVGKDWGNNCELNLGDAPLGSRGVLGEAREVAMVGGQFVPVQARGDAQGPDYVCLHRPREDTSLIFLNVQKVYKPSRSGTLDTLPAPNNLVGWFEHHPYLQADKPEAVSVGGVKGEQFDVVVEHLPEAYTGTCGSECLDLFALSDGSTWAVAAGPYKNRFTIVEDAKAGETVTIIYGSPAAWFDKFAPKAERVLESVRWRVPRSAQGLIHRSA